MKPFVHIAAFALLFAGASLTRADSLEEQRWKANYEKDLQLSLDAANKHCGATMTAKIDWSAMKYDDFVHKMGSPQLAPNTVESVCATGDDAKAAVRKQIKAIVVKPMPVSETKLELKDGELDLIIAPNHFLMREDAKAWLLKHL
ncbi:MAG TPA: hypothetical protein VGL61_15530 [Kofleriaceae bacterium]|jgi:hypothetical protein